MPTFMQPLYVVANGFGDVAILAVLIMGSPVLVCIPGLQLLGRYSLLVYLIHPILYKPIFLLLLPHFNITALTTGGDVLHYLAGSSISIASATSVSLLAAVIIHRSRLRTLITPRSFSDWLPVALAQAVLSSRAGNGAGWIASRPRGAVVARGTAEHPRTDPVSDRELPGFPTQQGGVQAGGADSHGNLATPGPLGGTASVRSQ
jgi:hypothetical protein